MAQYSALNNSDAAMHGSPYQNAPQLNEATGFIEKPARRRTSNWVKIGVPVAIIVVIGAVLGGVLGSRAEKKHSSSSSSNAGAGTPSGEAAASSAASVKNAIGIFATATNSEFMVPIYPSATNAAAYTSPTFIPSDNSSLAWPQDSFQPSSPNVLNLRPDRPVLIAPAYKWQALPALIANDPYLTSWNNTIFGNASDYFNAPPVPYFLDGGNGILDVARQNKERMKAFGYAWRMTNDTKWLNRTMAELQNAANYGSDPDRWNSVHFLDTAELSAAFGIAYDWMYDGWTDDQKSFIRSTVIKYGLSLGVEALTVGTNGWWSQNITGNWNCVCNGGLTMASLAILNDDTTGTAKQLLGLTVNNAKENCALAVSDDGTWAETANYWYFGTTGHAEMTSSLQTATGSDYGLATVNSNFDKTGDYHMFVFGPTSLFDYGDAGPNKFSTTANSMVFYATQYNRPDFALFQRDRSDAADPWNMFWYSPTVSGAYWDGKALDNFFDNQADQWASMRSSWTDEKALFVAMKAGTLQGHQTHNDLDCGDFVIDALGTRFAGELGSGNYNSPNYFSNDTQESDRWLYYRKMTEGQNTILINQANQLVTAKPTIISSGSSGTTQGSSTVFSADTDSTAFWVADISSAYADASSVKRGVRLLNGRKQVLIQDEITATGSVMWRMHTNATVSTNGASATLTRDGQSVDVTMLNPPSGASFSTMNATRFPTNPTPPEADQPNPGITVLTISLPAGTYNLQVLFNPNWNDGTNFVTPPSVSLDSWTLTSHN